MCAMPFRLFAYLQIQKNQSHYIEVMQGATFCGKEYEIWADFGPVGNTEKQILGQMQRYTYRVLQKIQMKLILLRVWAERAVLGSAKTALKFRYEI